MIPCFQQIRPKRNQNTILIDKAPLVFVSEKSQALYFISLKSCYYSTFMEIF